MDKLNGFNNGMNTLDGVGGTPGIGGESFTISLSGDWKVRHNIYIDTDSVIFTTGLDSILTIENGNQIFIDGEHFRDLNRWNWDESREYQAIDMKATVIFRNELIGILTWKISAEWK